MRNNSLEQQSVARVAAQLPEARRVLRSYRIDSTNRMTLAQAAAAASVEPDALMAELEYRARWMGRRSSVRHEEVEELEEMALA
jgi:iron-sulfur cluster repair protein YtfE (RIC family)